MGWTQNFSNPEGFLGQFILNVMNRGHAPVAKWTISHCQWPVDGNILDIGCGGGMNLKRLQALCPKGKVSGIDISLESVRKSKKMNLKALGLDCDIKLASADDIPYQDDTFDVVTTFESIYYWPDLDDCFDEIRRVLKPGGTFMVTCRISDPDNKWAKMVEDLHVYSADELKEYFLRNGFENFQVDYSQEVWMCMTAQKAR